MMATTPICSTVIHKKFVHPTTKSVSFAERVLKDDAFSVRKHSLFIPLFHVQRFGKKRLAVHCDAKSCLRNDQDQKDGLSYLLQSRSSLQFKNFIEKTSFMLYGMERNEKSTSKNNSQKVNLEVVSGSTGNQIKALDSYLSKLHKDTDNEQATLEGDSKDFYRDDYQENTRFRDKMTEDALRNLFKTRSGLGSLKKYFGKHDTDSVIQNGNSESSSEKHSETNRSHCENSINEKYQADDQIEEGNLGNFASRSNIDDNMASTVSVDKNDEEHHSVDEGSDFYLISLLVSINISVFLFAIASPVGKSSLQQLSLPLMYGAKVNKLILDGEWWRLVTPMFLHSGFLHVAFSCWALLSFGPQVCRVYGPLTFMLVYILGGVCASVTSFIHTPELTVSGTGPVFAIIGAWLIYQFQNKETISPEVSESMYWKAVVATALGFLLTYDGQIDEWTHLGAALSGISYGYLTCPTTNLENMSAGEGQKEGIAFAGQKSNPWKSIFTFIVSILTLSSLVYLIDPEVDLLDLGNLL